jgi:hypothetical protein
MFMTTVAALSKLPNPFAALSELPRAMMEDYRSGVVERAAAAAPVAHAASPARGSGNIWDSYADDPNFKSTGTRAPKIRPESLLSIRQRQAADMLANAPSEHVRKLDETLDNINEQLYRSNRKFAKIVPLTKAMVDAFGQLANHTMARLATPPTTADDYLHVTRLIDFIVSGETKTLKHFIHKLNSLTAIGGTRAVARAPRTPLSPRTMDENDPSTRGLTALLTDLAVLNMQLKFNIVAITHDFKVRTLIFHSSGNNWLVVYITKAKHIELICDQLDEEEVRIVFSPKDPSLTTLLTKLQVDMNAPKDVMTLL